MSERRLLEVLFARPRRMTSEIYHVALAGILIAGLVVAYVTTSHYGESFDEHGDASYASASLRAYEGSKDFLSHGDHVYYGPFYLMIWRTAQKTLKGVHQGWMQVDAGHFLNFLTYLIGLAAFYWICLRLAHPPVALAATLLFAMQPMIYGHAFINQKDIPFMTFVILAVAAGMSAFDSWAQQASEAPRETSAGVHRLIGKVWHSDVLGLWRGIWRHHWKASAYVTAFALVVIFLSGHPLAELIERTVRDAYSGTSIGLVNEYFRRIAQHANSLPADAYIAKAMALYNRARWAVGLLLLPAVPLVLRKLFPATLAGLGADRLWRLVSIMVAGVLMGLATSIRIAGPLAGGLVSVYAIARARRWAFMPLLGYWTVAGMAMYLTWPYLWGAPLKHLVKTFSVMSDFRAHTVLYGGAFLHSSSLPWDYLPRLMSLELTIPALLLFIWGSITISIRLMHRQISWATAAIPILWLGVPFLAFIILRTPIYGQIRQVLFALPSLFLVAAVGMDDLWTRLGRPALRAGFVVLILAPAVVGIVSLHPYEYVYFNQLAGGVDGADGVYDLDVWCTSYRGMMAYVDSTAPRGATVAAWGPVAAAADFARPDLEVVGVDPPNQDARLALGCSRALLDSSFYQDYRTVYEVKRGSAVLGVVKVKPDNLDP